MPDPIYVPVLKGRQGEFNALTKIQPVTRRHILPLVEIVPPPTDDRVALQNGLDRTVKKLRPWFGDRILLDAGLLTPDVALRGEQGATGYAVEKAHEYGILAVPVVGLGDDVRVHLDAAASHGETSAGVAIRLTAEDMDEDGEDIGAALTALMGRLSVARTDVDLILDVGALESDLAVRAGSRLVRDVVGELADVANWRMLVVTSGAFPADLSGVEPWVLAELPRRDAALWDRVQRRRIPRVPTYGDYGVAHPLLVVGPAFPPAPQLRYTVFDRWLALKGRRNDPRGHEQFHELCDQIATHPDFAGAALGQADARIAGSRAHGAGNPSTWREIGTTHHLDYVVQRLTILGEP